MKVLAFDIGGTMIKYALMDENAHFFNQGKFPTPQTCREDLLEALASIYKKYPEAEAMAIAMPGIIDSSKGYCAMGGALRYNNDFYMQDALYKKCQTKILLANDAKCAVMAEASLGSLKDVNDGIVILLGTMIGGGIIHNRKLIAGTHFSAGEVSYIMTSGEKQPNLTQYWGNQCSVLELCRLYAKEAGLKLDDVDGEKVFNAYHEGRKEAQKALSEYSRNVALQIFNLQTVFDPERFAIGGGVSAQEALIKQIQIELEKLYEESPYPLPKAEVVKCTFGNDANLIGVVQYLISKKS